jgi:hypothetical protein
VSHRKTFPFGLRPPSDVYKHQAAKSTQIQSGPQQPTSDLKVKSRARRDHLDVSCIYYKGVWHTLRPVATVTSKEATKIIEDSTHRFGVPNRIITDLGKAFTGLDF